MTNFEFRHNLLPGDVLVRNKSVFGIIDHYGLYVGNGEVIDNHPDRGVGIVGLGEFLGSRQLERIARFKGNAHGRRNVVNKAFSMLGMRYHLTNFNCEHFVNVAWGAGRKSKQVSTASALLWTSLVLWGVSNVGRL